MHSPLLSAIGGAALFVVGLKSAHGEMRPYFSCEHRLFFSVITLVSVINEKKIMKEKKIVQCQSNMIFRKRLFFISFTR